MLKFWSDCKLGVKLQAAFSLVILVVISAVGGVLLVNTQITALTNRQTTTLVPARAAINRLETLLRTADDEGAYYVMEDRPAESAQYLAEYRRDLAAFEGKLAEATKRANSDVQRTAIAQVANFANGPHGWEPANEAAFALKAAGKVVAARQAYMERTPQPADDAATVYRLDLVNDSNASYAELNRLQDFGRKLGISLAVLAMLLGAAVATLMSRSISRSIGATTFAIKSIVEEDIAALALALGHLAGGDLTARFASRRTPLPVTGTDEIGTLMSTYNELAEALNRIAGQFTATTAQALVEREKASLAITRADIMQAGKTALEREMGARRRVEQQLAFAAFHDELTGLANRALLMTRLDRIVAQTYTADHLWAILFIDLDRFKVINDSLGHALGDLVLVETARRLERCLRSGDTLARMGGDEFIILLDDIENVGVACEVAQRLLRALDAPFAVAGHEVCASASIGIAMSRNREDQPEDILRNADIAMYRRRASANSATHCSHRNCLRVPSCASNWRQIWHGPSNAGNSVCSISR